MGTRNTALCIVVHRSHTIDVYLQSGAKPTLLDASLGVAIRVNDCSNFTNARGRLQHIRCHYVVLSGDLLRSHCAKFYGHAVFTRMGPIR